jgi:hypothetical protein
MKTLDQILLGWKERGNSAFDGRDASRLAPYFPLSDWKTLGLAPAEGYSGHEVKELTREAVLGELVGDLDFAFEKALNQRGLSAAAMYGVVKMWMWVLDDPLADADDDYRFYGLPFFKAVAVKYHLANPIGDDAGTELKYGD